MRQTWFVGSSIWPSGVLSLEVGQAGGRCACKSGVQGRTRIWGFVSTLVVHKVMGLGEVP